MHVSADLLRGHCFDYGLAVSFSPSHTEKFVCRARVARKLAFWFCFPRLWNQCETRHLWSFSVVGWCCAEMSWNIGLLCVCVCVRHAFYVSVLIQPSSLPLPDFVLYSHNFQSTACCSSLQEISISCSVTTPLPCLYLTRERSALTRWHCPAFHFVQKKAIVHLN